MRMLRSWPTKIPNMNKIQQKTNDKLRTQGLGTDERMDGQGYSSIPTTLQVGLLKTTTNDHFYD